MSSPQTSSPGISQPREPGFEPIAVDIPPPMQEQQVALDPITFATMYQSWFDAYHRDPATAGPPLQLLHSGGVERLAAEGT